MNNSEEKIREYVSYLTDKQLIELSQCFAHNGVDTRLLYDVLMSTYEDVSPVHRLELGCLIACELGKRISAIREREEIAKKL